MKMGHDNLPPTVALETRVVCGSGGGPDKTIFNTPRFLSSAGYRTICAYMHPPDDPGFEQLRAKARLSEARLLSVPDRGPWDWRVAAQMLEICRQENVTLWHSHDYKSNALGLWLRRKWPLRLVTTVHGWVQQTRRTPLYYWIDRLCLRRYERVICVSEDLYERCLQIGVPRERCVLVENGIDTAEFSRRASTDEAKSRLGVRAGRIVVGAVGRLSAEKGFDLLIHAVKQLADAGVDLELRIIGEGDARSRLESLISSLALGERVHLPGYRSDVRGLYEAMDLFVLSSIREGLPNVLLEALALEVPIVATRVAGVPRLLQHDVNGWLVEPGDVGALTQGITALLTNPARRTRFRQAGRRCVESRYSFATRMQRIRQLYDDLLGRSAHEVAESPAVLGRSAQRALRGEYAAPA
jgi:glycosyltransferase involved in cell wall biosynthesis